ncbi:MAG: MFS transporter [Pseudomonadota bacterium]
MARLGYRDPAMRLHLPKNRDLRTLLLAQLPADFADWLDFVAIGALLAFTWEVPTVVFAYLAVAMGLPYLLIGPVAGALVDRVQVRSALIASNLARGVATAALFLAPDWPTLLALVALSSSVDTIFTPAKQVALQALTAPPERTAANGLSHAINQTSKIAAPGLGGALLIWVAPGTVFLLNAGPSLLAALLSARLRPVPRPPVAPDGAGLLTETREGLSEVRSNRIVRAALGLMAGGYFAMFLYDTFIAPLTRDLGFTPTHLGLALAAVGAGGVCGATLLGLAPNVRRPDRWIAMGAVVSGLSTAFLGWWAWSGAGFGLAALLTIFAVLGLASAMAFVPFRTILQDAVPEARMGRVTALGEAVNTVALLSAPLVGAYLVSALSIGAPFVFGGLVMGGIALGTRVLRSR